MRTTLMLTTLAIAAGVAGCDDPAGGEPLAPGAVATDQIALAVAQTEVVASGLKSPRGFTWGPDGSLYIAEAGTGGPKTTTPAQCEQVAPPVGPYSNGSTSRITKVSPEGRQSVFARGFPSALDAMGNTLGLADVAFLDGELYALSGGGGCGNLPGFGPKTSICRPPSSSRPVTCDSTV